MIEAPGEMIKGVLFDVDPAEIEALDILEDVHKGLYVRETFYVFGEDGNWYHADLYRVANPSGPYKPAKQYVQWMVDGAREQNIDPEYTAKLVELLESL